jgi:hypothetical protein
MRNYLIRDYQKGYEPDQVRIGLEVARHWIWPYAYHLDGLLKVHSQPDFDPSTRHYCFLGDEMVGYMFSIIHPCQVGEVPTATLDFPRMLPGHESVAELLVAKAMDTLRKKGVYLVTGRVTTMVPGDIHLARKMGFTLRDWGYKIYYSYEMKWGRLNLPDDMAEDVDPLSDLQEAAMIATLWYDRPPEWCFALLQEWHEEGLIAHLCVREQGKMVASCLAAPNDVRRSTAAIFYIYSPVEYSLKPMLVKVVNHCVEYGVQNLIVDLINDHRQYESVYQELGFKKVADWAKVEKNLF